jgi:hypothetical protein
MEILPTAIEEVKFPSLENLKMIPESRSKSSIRKITKRKLDNKTELSQYTTIQAAATKRNKHFNPNPLIPVKNREI